MNGNGSIALTEPLFDTTNEHVNRSLNEDEVIGIKRKRSILNYLFVFHVIQVCLMFAGVVNLLVYASLFYFVYPIFFAFLFYVCVYHSFRRRLKWILIPYFIYEAFFLLYNIFLALIMFMYSAHTIEFLYLNGTPTHIAEIIGALELLIIPCQCVFFFIMIRCWHGHKIEEFVPKGHKERRIIFGVLTLLILATIGSMIYAQISGFF